MNEIRIVMMIAIESQQKRALVEIYYGWKLLPHFCANKQKLWRRKIGKRTFFQKEQSINGLCAVKIEEKANNPKKEQFLLLRSTNFIGIAITLFYPISHHIRS